MKSPRPRAISRNGGVGMKKNDAAASVTLKPLASVYVCATVHVGRARNIINDIQLLCNKFTLAVFHGI